MIIKQLFPHLRIENPLEEQLYYYAKHHLSKRETAVLNQLIKAITILHYQARERSFYDKIIVEQEDINMALFLMQRELPQKNVFLSLTPNQRRIFSKLELAFGDNKFKRIEAMNVINRSKTTTWKRLWELETRGLIKKVGGIKERGY